MATASLTLTLVDKLTGPLKGVNKALGSVQRAIDQNNRQLDAMRGRLVEAVAVGAGLFKALQAPTQAAMEFESAMADVRKVVDFKDGEAGVKKFGRDLMALSERVPVAADELTKVATAAGQFGLKENEILPYTEMAAKVGVAFDMAAGDISQGMAEIMSGAKMTIPEVSSLADSINHLSNNSPANARKIFETVKGVAAQGKIFGFSAQQTAAFAAQMTGAGYASEVAGTSFKNMGRYLTEGGAATKSRRAAMGSLGFSPERLAKDMQKDAVGTTLKVMKAIKKARPDKQSSLVSQIFGNEAQAIYALIGDIEGLELALKRATDEQEYANSAQKEYESRIKTTEASVQLAQNAFKNLSVAIGMSLLPVVKGASDGLVPIIQGIRQFVHENEALVRTVIMATSGLVAFRVAGVAAQFAALYLKGAILQVAGVALKAVRGLLMLLNPIKLVTGALALLRGAFLLSGVGAILMAIGLAGAFIYNNWEGVSAAFSGFGEAFMAALGPAGGMLQPVIEGAKQVWQWVTDLVKPLDVTKEQWKDWGANIGRNVGEFVRDIPGALRSIDWSGLARSAGQSLAGLARRATAILRSIDWKALGAKAGELLKTGPAILQSMLNSINWGGLTTGILNAVTAAFTGMTAIITTVDWNNLGRIIGGLLGDALAGAMNLVSKIIDSFRGASGAGGLGQALLDLWMASISAGWGFFSGFLQGLFGNINLHDAGAKLMQSLWDGLKSLGGEIKSWIASLFNVDVRGALSGAFNRAKEGLFGSTPTPANDNIGKRASGGPIQAFKPYLVGERGPELIMPAVNGMVMNARETAALMRPNLPSVSRAPVDAMANARTPAGRSGGGSITNNVTFDIKIQGGANMDAASIRRELSREASAIMRRHFSDGIT